MTLVLAPTWEATVRLLENEPNITVQAWLKIYLGSLRNLISRKRHDEKTNDPKDFVVIIVLVELQRVVLFSNKPASSPGDTYCLKGW